MPTSPIRLIYDISVLGGGHYHAPSRTGIARAVEQVAAQLAHMAGVDPQWCAFESVDHWLKTYRYLRRHGHGHVAPLLPPDGRSAGRLLPWLGRVYPDPDVAQPWDRYVHAAAAKMRAKLGRSTPATLPTADIFHSTFFPFPDGSRGLRGVQRFITVYDLIPLLFPQFFRAGDDHLFKATLASIERDDWVLAISAATRNDLCERLGIDPARVFVTHLAAAAHFRPCTDTVGNAAVLARYGIPEGPYLLSLCTFEPRKNIAQVIRSYADLVRQQGIRDLNLVLVGSKGWDFERIFAEIGTAGDLRERIVVTGYVPDQDIPAIYGGAMMFAYPSFYEGFGLPPLEAMQCGVPVITGNTSSLPEVVGDAGIMVDPQDGDALSEAILALYRSQALRHEMSAKALQRATQFSWEKCAEQTVAAYRQALGR